MERFRFMVTCTLQKVNVVAADLHNGGITVEEIRPITLRGQSQALLQLSVTLEQGQEAADILVWLEETISQKVTTY